MEYNSKTFQDFSKLVSNFEGGLSKDKIDYASKNPVPDGSGYHTNRGIQWITFKDCAKKVLNVEPTPTNFYALTHTQATKILYFYAEQMKINQLPDSIGLFLTDFSWASGIGGSTKQIQKWFLGFSTGFFGSLTLASLTSNSESQTLEKLYENRIKFNNQLGYPKSYIDSLNKRLKITYEFCKKQINPNSEKKNNELNKKAVKNSIFYSFIVTIAFLLLIYKITKSK